MPDAQLVMWELVMCHSVLTIAHHGPYPSPDHITSNHSEKLVFEAPIRLALRGSQLHHK